MPSQAKLEEEKIKRRILLWVRGRRSGGPGKDAYFYVLTFIITSRRRHPIHSTSRSKAERPNKYGCWHLPSLCHSSYTPQMYLFLPPSPSLGSSAPSLPRQVNLVRPLLARSSFLTHHLPKIPPQPELPGGSYAPRELGGLRHMCRRSLRRDSSFPSSGLRGNCQERSLRSGQYWNSSLSSYNLNCFLQPQVQFD